MATSAFRSTSKRTPAGKSSSSSAAASTDDLFSSNRTSSAHRRSRSLSRFSRPLYSPGDDFSDDPPTPKGRFVNSVRGPGFTDVTNDDLAVKLFSSADRGRSASKNGKVSPGEKSGYVSQRRGRSVARYGSRIGEGKGNAGNSSGGGRLNSENNARRRRSVSVVRRQISDSESDLELYPNSNNGGSLNVFTGRNNQAALANKTIVSSHRQGLRRSLSQRDLKYHDGYSSHSSVISITDDEGRDVHANVNGAERIIRTVYTQKKAEHLVGDDLNSGLYEVMRKELWDAVKDIRMEVGHVIENRGMKKPSTSILTTAADCLQQKNSDAVGAVSTMKKNCTTKLEMSEKRKQELLAEILLEERRGGGLSRIVKELLVDAKDTIEENPIGTRKRSNDRNRMSKQLNEEAAKYFEDFVSSVEDTDISSLDGEKSDTSSSIGGITRTHIFHSPALPKPAPVEMDGIILPWLKWETSNDSSPLSSQKELKATPSSKTSQDLSNYSVSSSGSWSPRVSCSINVEELTRKGLREREQRQLSCYGPKLQFDVDEYLNGQREEILLFERLKQQQRIYSGTLLLCNHMFI